MSRTTSPPELTPAFCFSTTTLREFLRLSRSSVDDSVSQYLSSLARPPNFDPSSTYTRQPSHRLIETPKIDEFLDKTLYPTWSSRNKVIAYCTSVATSPDPDDPDTLDRLAKTEREREKVVNDRLDPYSSRNLPKETRTETLASIIRQERQVEEIVRERTWGTVKERSADGRGGVDWRQAFEKWQKDKE